VANGTIQHADHIESRSTLDYEKNISFFTTRAYDVIITVGMGQRIQTLEAARAQPNIIFLGLDQTLEDVLPNLYIIVFPHDKMGFFAGALAAMFTTTGVVGAVCETSEIDSVWQTCEGFTQGAQKCAGYCKPPFQDEIEVLVRYRDNQDPGKLFDDAEWGETAAHRLIRNGADVILGFGGATGQAALVASAEQGIFSLGAEKDQWYALPGARPSLITSVYPDTRFAVHDWLIHYYEDALVEKTTPGSITYAPFHDLDLKIDEGTRHAITDLLLALQSGVINTGNSEKAP
jgi:basic membrane protein A